MTKNVIEPIRMKKKMIVVQNKLILSMGEIEKNNLNWFRAR